MSMLDIFNDDAFSVTSLSAAISQENYRPGKLGAMGLFEEDGITTTTAVIEVEDDVLHIVDVKPRGAAGSAMGSKNRKVIPFAVPHLPQTGAIMADQVQNVRAFGSEDKVQAVQDLVVTDLRRMAQRNEYTIESHRVAAVQGQYMDAGGNLQSIYTAFGVTEQVVPMALTQAETKLRNKCTQVIDKVEDALGGLGYESIHVECGKTFWDNLIEHPAVKETYLASVHAAELRGDTRQMFKFGGLVWERYNGTSDVKIADTEARAFPTGVMDLFITRFSPADYVETVNTKGLPYYGKTERMPFDKGVNLEAQSNPLNICTRPKALIKLKNAAS